MQQDNDRKIGHYHPTTLFVSPKFSKYLYFLLKIMQKIWEKISFDIKYWYLQEKIIYENLFTIENLGNLGFFSPLQPNTKNKGGYMNGKRIQKLHPPWNTFNLNKKKQSNLDKFNKSSSYATCWRTINRIEWL